MTQEKKKFEEPKIEIIRFTEEDIITTSTGWRDPAELEEIED